MYYKVRISQSAQKFISKLNGKHKKRIAKFIDILGKYPIPRKNQHILDRTGSSLLCEYSIEELRFYYTIENQFVVIENIEYKGIVEVLEAHANHKSGNKRNWSNQRKTIKNLLDWFSRVFR